MTTAKPAAPAPRIKQPNEALPQQNSYKTSVYKIGDGDRFAPVRPGALDFLKYKSKGF
jgi:hypothetical protein